MDLTVDPALALDGTGWLCEGSGPQVTCTGSGPTSSSVLALAASHGPSNARMANHGPSQPGVVSLELTDPSGTVTTAEVTVSDPTDPSPTTDPTVTSDPTVTTDPTFTTDPTLTTDPTFTKDPTFTSDPTVTVTATATATITAPVEVVEPTITVTISPSGAIIITSTSRAVG